MKKLRISAVVAFLIIAVLLVSSILNEEEPIIDRESKIPEDAVKVIPETDLFAPILQLLKETGMRIGELRKLTWTDVSLENRAIRVTPEKGSNPRMFQISSKLKAMLSELQNETKSEYVFPKSVRNQRRIFQRQRKRIAKKLRNPRIEKITFHTFRHFKATMEYHKTKDILHVMRILGHKNINNTLIYTHLVDFKDDEYISKVATNAKEACNLVESGFEFICEVDGSHIFRKRK